MEIISVHSFRGGTGKSNTAANLAAVMALSGKRVGVVDTDIHSPGIHVLFNVHEDEIEHPLNDYLWGKCSISDTAIDVSDRLGQPVPGRIFLIASSMKSGDIARVLREGYDVGLLNDGYQRLMDDLNLDVLLIDTHPGLNEETLLSIAISDALVLIMRPDSQDYQGNAVTVEVAKKLDVPHMLIVVNKAPPTWNLNQIKARVERTFDCPVAAVLPHSDEMMTLASEGIFVTRYPNHPMTSLYKQIAHALNI